MGVRILEDKNYDQVCLYCSTTDWAFGPIMGSVEEAEAFLEFLVEDARSFTDRELEAKYCDFRKEFWCAGCESKKEECVCEKKGVTAE